MSADRPPALEGETASLFFYAVKSDHTRCRHGHWRPNAIIKHPGGGRRIRDDAEIKDGVRLRHRR